ncbi:hypothetical protein XFLM_11575 [Xylella fastidiosa subsp. fastidiosa GB514]|nr:hypothetical protein XFLM_11575 [Xylella fastidiosa subsp. fastidiosa GB514]KAF0570727.1 hypothetical protein P305_11490 [Xylella fastidiosa subsp. fastidiosa Mus-1]SHG98234.1 hypothetical protein SAMN05660380_01855 [Xylella fastidiosa]
MLLRAYSDKQTAQVIVLVCVMRWLIDSEGVISGCAVLWQQIVATSGLKQ